MSAFETARLILTRFPFIIFHARQYRSGFQPLRRWNRFRTQFISFIDVVDLERIRFEQMLEHLLRSVNIASDELPLFFTTEIFEGWSRKSLVTLLQSYLGSSYAIYLRKMETVNNLMGEMEALLSLENGEVVWANNGAARWNDQLGRVHSNFISNGNRVLDLLETNNRQLQELLQPKDKFDTMRLNQNDTKWAKVFENIRQHAISLHNALRSGWNCSCPNPHQGGLRLEKRHTAGSPAKFNVMFTAPTSSLDNACREVVISLKGDQFAQTSSYSPSLESPMEQDQDLRRPGDVRLGSKPFPYLTKPSRTVSPSVSPSSSATSPKFEIAEQHQETGEPNRHKPSMQNEHGSSHLKDGTRPISRFLGGLRKPKKSVRIDVAPQPPLCPPTHTEETETAKTARNPPVSRIDDLCSAIWSSEISNICLGYLQDDLRRQFELYSTQSLFMPRGEYGTVTLEDLLKNRGEQRLSRQVRYQIASIVASSMLQLETTPWLLGKLGKKNIIFCQQNSKVFVDSPYIYYSFNSNRRPVSTIEHARKETASRFATKDGLRSFGILLLELCFGETIESQHLRERHLGQDGQPIGGTDLLTALDWVEMVSEEDPALEQIIKCCVLCNFPEKADWTNREFTQSVHASVVQPLERLVGERFSYK